MKPKKEDNMNNKSLKIKRITGIAVFAALVVVLQLFSNYVQFGPVSITLALIPIVVGSIITILTVIIIFGGVNRIAKISSIIVPFMAIAYIIVALFIVFKNITSLPNVFKMIFENAFGFNQFIGGGIGAALLQGIKRGLFSNEAGMGSAPNAAATANVTHPVKQGFIQTLGVFTDTLIIC